MNGQILLDHHTRIAIIGNSGSGKSTLARVVAEPLSAKILDLDRVAWEPNQIAVPRPIAAARSDVDAFCTANENWVIEGCYAELIDVALSHTPLLLFLDLDAEDCIANCVSRPWEPHKYPSKKEQDAKLEFLLAWVHDYYRRDGDLSHAAHSALFDRYVGPKRRFHQRPSSPASD